jgi:hypothetical protein
LLAGTASAQVVINEIRIDHSGSDTDEYFELVGAAGTPLTGMHYLTIGDSSGTTSGTIEAVVDLDGLAIPSSGIFLAAESSFTLPAIPDLVTTLDFENNDNVTHLLVSGFTGVKGTDVDTDDDGVIDAPAWSTIIDLVAVIEEGNPPYGTEYHYGPPTVGPELTFSPGHVFRYPDGASDFYSWNVGDFTLGVDDTPGVPNPVASVSASLGGTHEMIVNPGATPPTAFYLVVGSLSGTAPSFPLQTVSVPLVFDSYTRFLLSDPNTLISNSFALHPTSATMPVSQATLTLPADPALAGMGAHHAYIVVDALTDTVTMASQALPLSIGS